MKSRLNKTDYVFGIAFVLGLIFLGAFMFYFPYSQDESLYLNIPFRLINGDSLVGDEWHLTQFSSLFSYLPVFLWIKITGSTEGIFVFTRCVYVLLIALLTVAVYRFFREYKTWAVIAAVLFLTQFVNVMWQISYHSMFVCFVLLLSFSVLSVYRKGEPKFYIFAGISYGACCICNPIFCIAFFIYLAFCGLWKFRGKFTEAVVKLIRLKRKIPKPKEWFKKKPTKKKKRKKAKQEEEIICFPDIEKYTCLFSTKAIAYSLIGLAVIAVIAIIFFFATGGTISSVINNVDNLFAFSEYGSRELSTKLSDAYFEFSVLCFNKPYLLFVLFAILLLDRKRTANSHRCVYLLLSLVLAIVYSIFIFQKIAEDVYFFEFPFFIFSTVSYIVTKCKNKVLFRCMWIPCVIAMIFHFFASASLLSAVNVVLITCNTAGIFFVSDLFNEIRSEQSDVALKRKGVCFFSVVVLCITIVLQLFFHASFYKIALYTPSSSFKATEGPYAGLYMTEEQYEYYTNTISDLNLIKEQIGKDSPIYVPAYQNWIYIHLERPVGIHTSYYLGTPSRDLLDTYYKENPENIPEYIYIPSYDYFNKEYYETSTESITYVLEDVFDFTTEELSNGTLLKIVKYKPYT